MIHLLNYRKSCSANWRKVNWSRRQRRKTNVLFALRVGRRWKQCHVNHLDCAKWAFYDCCAAYFLGGHQVVCRRCFVKTIQSAVAQRLLPLRCVICRARINRLTSASGTWRLQESASSYSVGSKSWSVSCAMNSKIKQSMMIERFQVPGSASSYSVGAHSYTMGEKVTQSASLYSMSSGSSCASGVKIV